MPSLSDLLSMSSATALIDETFTYTNVSSIMALMGWRDNHSRLMQAANEHESELSATLQADYTQYLVSRDEQAFANLNNSLNAVISNLENNKALCIKLAKKASQEAFQSDYVKKLTEKFKTILGLDNNPTLRHYEQQALMYSKELQKFLQLRDSLQNSHKKIIESAHTLTQRHLLQMSNSSLPLSTSQFCYPAGICNLGSLSNGLSGFTLQGAMQTFAGFKVSTAGDFNGDGFDDVITGADYNSADNRGRAYLIFGTNNNNALFPPSISLNPYPSGQRGFTMLGEEKNDMTGHSLAKAGDINGDGFPDLIIGAASALNDTGKSYIIFGTNNSSLWASGFLNLTTTVNGQNGFVLIGETPTENSGYVVSGIGDFNGDGLSDIAIGAPPLTGINRGKCYVIFGNRSSLAWGNGLVNLNSLMDGHRGFVLHGEASNSLFGLTLSFAGDINDDGFSDLAIGAMNFGVGIGKTYIVFGTNLSNAWGSGVLNISNIMDAQRGFALVGNGPLTYIGKSFAGGGDINRDGITDLLIGTNTGISKAYVIFGTNNSSQWGNGTLSLGPLMDGVHGFSIEGDPNDVCGNEVKHLNDINGDGLSDLYIGCMQALSSTGKGYVIFGNDNSSLWGNGILNLSTLADGYRGFILQGEWPYSFSSCSADEIGDFNGDGELDLVIGSYGASKAYVVFGANLGYFYFTQSSFSIGSGETIILTTEHVNLLSNDALTNVNNVLFSIENLSNGYFSFKFQPSIPITSFYMQNISDELIQFEHTGQLFPPDSPTIRSERGPVSIFTTLAINFLGYRPILGNNQLRLSQGRSTVVGISDLSIIDQDTNSRELHFIISNLLYGYFSLYNSTTGISQNVTQFTQQDVLNRFVNFTQDGSAHIPSYAVAVTDGKSITGSQEAAISFNYAPQLNISTSPIIIDQGQGTPLNPQDIFATDVETFEGGLIFEVSNVSGGFFSYITKQNTSIVEFQQLWLTTGSVQFSHNGSANTPTFALRVFDGLIYSSWQSPQIYLNQRPLLQRALPYQSVSTDEEFSFEFPANLFIDPDNDTLVYKVSSVGTEFLPVGLTYVAPRQLKGSFANPGSFNIEITAIDPRGLRSVSTNFILDVKALDSFDYRALFTTLGSIAGTILGYLWLRIYIAKHRRDFPLANDLRKVLNLEYFDFNRFSGDTYKSSVNNFFQYLQTQYNQFYTNLSPTEQKSFAVCLAEILYSRGLVVGSSCPMGLFGILCFLNVGWPTELRLKEFEKNSQEIANAAVAAWKKESGYQLRAKADLSTGKAEKGTIYVEVKDNILEYAVYDVAVKRGGMQNTITAAQLNLTTLPTEIQDLVPYLAQIISIAKDRGDARSDKAQKRWVYHSPSKKEKFRVFCCCQKPYSAGLFSPANEQSRGPKGHESSSIELKKLSSYEGSRVTFFESENALSIRINALENRVEHISQRLRLEETSENKHQAL